MGNERTAPTRTEGLPARREAATAIEGLQFELLRSALYHDMRETSLTRLHKALSFASILLGSGAIAAFGAQFPFIGQAAGLCVATVAAVQLVFDFGSAARHHAELRKRFYGLLAKIETVDDTASIRADMTVVYADEPPMHDRTNSKAHDKAGKSLFGDDFTRA